MATTTIRDLRNQFPKVKKMVETEGEVIVTDNGEPKYRLTLYTPMDSKQAPPPKDYMARISRHQPQAIDVGTAQALHEENRGDR